MASTVGDVARSGCSAGNGARTSVETGARTRGDADGPEVTEGKVDITTPDKTSIMVSYQLNVRLFVKTYNVERKASRSTASQRERKPDTRQGERRDERRERRNAQDIRRRQIRHLYWLTASSTYDCLSRPTM